MYTKCQNTDCSASTGGIDHLSNGKIAPGVYVSYTAFHIPRSDKTEAQYEDAVWPRESESSFQRYRKINDIFRIAGADGVSAASRYTSLWAKLLTEAYGSGGIDFLKKIPELSEFWKSEALKLAKDFYLPNDLELYRRDKAEIHAKGASTTFAGVEIDSRERSIRFECIGDSCFFLIREQLTGTKRSNLHLEKHAILQVPNLNTPDLFTNCPPQIHDTTELKGYPMHVVGTQIEDKDTIVFATDAVAQWLVLDEVDLHLDEKLSLLLACNCQEDFENLILDMRERAPQLRDQENSVGRVSMHDDDSTISILKIRIIGKGG